jgi:hypothetical protein
MERITDRHRRMITAAAQMRRVKHVKQVLWHADDD